MLWMSMLLLSGVSITLPTEAQVGGAQILLGEIAEIRGTDEDAVARVRALDLGYAPSVGYSRLLPRWRIERAASDALPGVELRFAGAEAVRVSADVRELPIAEVEGAARAALERGMNGVTAVLTLVEPIPTLVVPRSTQAVQLDAQAPASDPAAGRWTVPVRVHVDGVLHRTVWTTWQVDLARPLPVLVRDVPAGERIGADAVRIESVRTDSRLNGAPVDATSLVGTVAARPLAAGSVLLERDVRRVLLVRQSELVQLEIQNGAVTARVAAIARQSGHHGSLVRVQVVTTGREVAARVVGEDLVQIALGGGR